MGKALLVKYRRYGGAVSVSLVPHVNLFVTEERYKNTDQAQEAARTAPKVNKLI